MQWLGGYEETIEGVLRCTMDRASSRRCARAIAQAHFERGTAVHPAEDALLAGLSLSERTAVMLHLIPITAQICELERFGSRPFLRNQTEAGHYLRAWYMNTTYEQFRMLLLDRDYRLIRQVTMNEGRMRQVEVYPREIADQVLRHEPAAVVIAHNHPGGSRQISESDVDTTRDLLAMLTSIRVALLDHLVLAGDSAVSLRSKDYIAEEVWLGTGDWQLPRGKWLL